MRRNITELFMCVLGWAGAAQAHHSAAMFDPTKRVTLTGTVKEWHFTNPHSWIYLEVPDDKGGSMLWKLEGGAVSHLVRNGWNYKSLEIGDKITVIIEPRIDGSPMGAFQSVQFASGNSLSTTN